MRRNPFAALSAATIVAALALSACSDRGGPASAFSPAPPPPSAVTAPPPTSAALPAPEALTDVLYRLADPAVTGTEKLQLVESTTPEDAATIDGFAVALRDGGFTPLTFTATDITWSDRQPGDALATVDVTTSNPANPGRFTFPMQFRAHQGGWQLSRETADILLAFGNARTEPSGAGAGPVSSTPAPASPAPTP